jgi:hypothetical protein
MKPVKYTKNNETYVFHYSFSDLREFILRGKISGDVGWILTKVDGKMHTFRGFGTIEHPMNEIVTITIMYNPLFDGNFNPDVLIDRNIKMENGL